MPRTSTSLLIAMMTWMIAASVAHARPVTLLPAWPARLVARSVYGGGEFHCVPFDGYIPCE